MKAKSAFDHVPTQPDPRDRHLLPSVRLRAAGLLIRQRQEGREPLWSFAGRVYGELEALRKFCGEPE
jgi:hypothetical protein